MPEKQGKLICYIPSDMLGEASTKGPETNLFILKLVEGIPDDMFSSKLALSTTQ
jgi:hypothetical protein